MQKEEKKKSSLFFSWVVENVESNWNKNIFCGGFY